MPVLAESGDGKAADRRAGDDLLLVGTVVRQADHHVQTSGDSVQSKTPSGQGFQALDELVAAAPVACAAASDVSVIRVRGDEVGEGELADRLSVRVRMVLGQ